MLHFRIQAGYPEGPDDGGRLFNSVCVVSPGGGLVTTYRKHFLFETDESWAGGAASAEGGEDKRVPRDPILNF